MSKTNTALKSLPNSIEEVAKRVMDLRQQEKDIKDEISFYMDMLKSETAKAAGGLINAGSVRIKRIEVNGSETISGDNLRSAISQLGRDVISPFIKKGEGHVRIDIKERNPLADVSDSNS